MAVDLADPVVHQDVRRAGRHRATPPADDGLRCQRPLDAWIVEPLVQQIRGAHREQPHHLVDVAAAEATELRGRAQPRRQVADPHVRRDHEQQRLHQAGDPFEVPIEPDVGLGVVRVERRDVPDVASEVTPERQRCAAGERHEVVGGDDRHLVAVPAQLQLADDPLGHQRDDVGGRRDPVAIPQILRRGRAAEDRAAFQDEDVAAGPREVRGARETVVPAPDHDHIVLVRAHGPQASLCSFGAANTDRSGDGCGRHRRGRGVRRSDRGARPPRAGSLGDRPGGARPPRRPHMDRPDPRHGRPGRIRRGLVLARGPAEHRGRDRTLRPPGAALRRANLRVDRGRAAAERAGGPCGLGGGDGRAPPAARGGRAIASGICWPATIWAPRPATT